MGTLTDLWPPANKRPPADSREQSGRAVAYVWHPLISNWSNLILADMLDIADMLVTRRTHWPLSACRISKLIPTSVGPACGGPSDIPSIVQTHPSVKEGTAQPDQHMHEGTAWQRSHASQTAPDSL